MLFAVELGEASHFTSLVITRAYACFAAGLQHWKFSRTDYVNLSHAVFINSFLRVRDEKVVLLALKRVGTFMSGKEELALQVTVPSSPK